MGLGKTRKKHQMIKVTKSESKSGDIVRLTLTNASGASVVLSTVGAGIVEVNVPDRDGRLADVTLGYADPTAYFGDGPAAGKIPGRYANRIALGRFRLGDREYQLPVNNGPNCNHGGDNGYHNRNWEVKSYTDNSVTFVLHSPDGDAGFPGNLTAEARYVWTDSNELRLTLTATTDAPTVVNLTNHAYWNLAGHNSGSVLGHELKLNATRYLPTDETLIPTGELASVAGTPMDFRSFKAIGRDIRADFPALRIGKGYDACWAVDSYTPDTVRTVASLRDAASGRILEVESDQPGVQVYTGNWLSGCPANKAGRSYDDYDGVAIECQGFPDSPNKPEFPSAVLLPGQTYKRHINFIFRTFHPLTR